ncbi:MAG: stage III sporulation protein AE [Oscillospiraceae bacterium]|nr:stage III sporulation protein AE [Oscillospiraceae bacterium]
MTLLYLMEITAPEVPRSGASLMPENTASFGDALWDLVGNAVAMLQPELVEAARVCLSILSIVLLICIIKLFPKAGERAPDFVAAIGISALLLQKSNSLINVSAQTIQEISQYGKLLLPVMTSTMAAQGGVTTSTALYVGTALFDTFLCSMLTRLMIPAVFIYLALSIANAALGEDLLKKMADFVKWLSVWILKIILYVFTGYMSITGVISGTTDAQALKAAKLTISGMVPVVGGILSDASEAVLVGAGVVRNAAGIYGILAVLSIFAGPFLKIGCHYLLIKLTGAVCDVFDVKSCTGLISGFSTAMGLMLAMTGSVCLLQMISTVCFLRGVG